MISEFRADELVTNLYTAWSTEQRGLNPDKFKNGATGYREPLLVRERKARPTRTTRRHRGRFARRRRRRRCPSVFVLCTGRQPDIMETEAGRKRKGGKISLWILLEAAPSLIHTLWKTRDRFRPSSLFDCLCNVIATFYVNLLFASNERKSFIEFQVFPIPIIFFSYI